MAVFADDASNDVLYLSALGLVPQDRDSEILLREQTERLACLEVVEAWKAGRTVEALALYRKIFKVELKDARGKVEQLVNGQPKRPHLWAARELIEALQEGRPLR